MASEGNRSGAGRHQEVTDLAAAGLLPDADLLDRFHEPIDIGARDAPPRTARAVGADLVHLVVRQHPRTAADIHHRHALFKACALQGLQAAAEGLDLHAMLCCCLLRQPCGFLARLVGDPERLLQLQLSCA